MRIELYHSYIDGAVSERLWESLPCARRTMLAPRTPVARAEGAALSALLTHAVASWGHGAAFQTVPSSALAVPFARWETAENGKPFPRGIETPQGMAYVSFAHSNGHLLVAVGDRPLGADLQVWDTPALAPDRFRRLASRITHPAETPLETPRETAQRFAAKEAVLKLSGEGLRRAMSSINLADFAVTFCEDIPDGIIAVAVSK